MRLTLLLALILGSCLLVNLINAGTSRSRNTLKKCKGPSSRGSTRCRSNVGKPTSTSNSNNSGTTRKPSTKPTRKTTRSTRLPVKKRTTVSSKENNSGSSSSSSSKLTTRKTTRSTSSLPKKKRTTVSSVSQTDEESDSVSTSKKIKASAKKYFQKVKSRLQEAAVWYVDNKDKTVDEILVERWREKGECAGAKSQKSKRKSCVSAALEESEDDTPEQKQVKDALKSLLEEDPDQVYEFLSTSSSRTFRDIENEEETQDKLTPDSGPSTSNLRNLGATRKPSINLPKKVIRKPLPKKKRPSFKQLPKKRRPTDVSSVSPTDDCQLPKNGRSKRSPVAPGVGCPAPVYVWPNVAPPPKPTRKTPVRPSIENKKKHFVDEKMIDNIFPPPGTGGIEDAVDELGKERWEALTETFDATQRWNEEFGAHFQPKNTVLSRKVLPLDLKNFTPVTAQKQGAKEYQEWRSDKEIEFVQIEWKRHGTWTNGREDGHFEVTKMKGYITIGVDVFSRGRPEVSHLKPDTFTPIGTPLMGNKPYKYTGSTGGPLDAHGSKGAGRGK